MKFLALVLPSALFLACAPASAQVLINVGLLSGGTFSNANGINDLNQVVGYGDTNGQGGAYNAFLYSGGTISNLSSWGGIESVAQAINNSSQVVGYSLSSTYQDSAILYSNGTVTTLLPGYASAINNSGQVVGTSSTGLGAFEYSNGSKTYTGPASGYANTYAYGINDSGVVVGTWTTYNGTGEGFINSGGQLTTIGPSGSSTYALAINNLGQIVGQSNASNANNPTAFLYSNGIMTNLGTIPNGYASYAVAINNLGEIVGSAETASNGLDHAFLYTSTLGLVDLNTLYGSLLVSGSGPQTGFTDLTDATDINDNGLIVGNGTYWNGSTLTTEGFVLTTPEPSTWALLLCGLGVLAFFRFREKRKRDENGDRQLYGRKLGQATLRKRKRGQATLRRS